jgi:8-oxo-dGTP pyrophosphatase MutT (NUDIX family)
MNLGGSGERSPWRTTATREVYSNPWITVREDQVVRPDGSPGIYGVMSTSRAVGVVAVTSAGAIVLVGQWRYTLGAYSWEIVEGGSDDGEAPLAAAKRELVEEAGYEAGSWSTLIGELALSNSVTDEVATVFLATDLTEVARDPDPTEILTVRHVDLDTALAAYDDGAITDAITVAALLTLDRRRARATDR